MVAAALDLHEGAGARAGDRLADAPRCRAAASMAAHRAAAAGAQASGRSFSAFGTTRATPGSEAQAAGAICARSR